MSTYLAHKLFCEAEKFEEKGFYKEAIEAYEKAVEIDPSLARAYHNLAILYHQSNQFNKAIANLKKALALDAGDASTYNNLGVLLSKTQKFDEAKECFEKALSIEGDYQEARDNLGKVLQMLQKAGLPTFVQQTNRIHHYNTANRANCKEKAYSVTLNPNDQDMANTNTFGEGQTIESDSAEFLHRFVCCPMNTNLIKNIIDSRVKHIMEFTGVRTDNLQQLVDVAGKIVEKEWFQFIQSGRPIKEFYSSLPKDVLFSYANLDGSGSYWRLEYVIRLLSPFISCNSTFLDFGAGIGEVGIYFSNICRVTMYDVPGDSQEFAKYHTHKLNSTTCFLNDLNDIKGNAFDVISAQDVLEHIENPMDIVEKLFCALKPEGYFITSGFWFNPNVPGHLASNIRYRNTWMNDFEKIGFKYLCRCSGSNWAVAVFQK